MASTNRLKHRSASDGNGDTATVVDGLETRGRSEGDRFGSNSTASTGRDGGAEDKEEADTVAGDNEFGLDPKWKNLEWWQVGLIMIAENISLGILTLPSVLATVGLIPGFILILGLGVLATYTGYVIGQYRKRNPHIHNYADAIGVLFSHFGPKWGRFGLELGGIGQILFLVFIMSSHILTWVICFDKITGHATCNIVWSVVGLAVFWAIDIPRTLKNASYWSIVSFVSVFTAVFVTMIAIGIKKPGTGVDAYRLWPNEKVTFQAAFLSVTNIIFSYAGHACFFTFCAEMKKPKEFPKALALCQTTTITLYIVTSIVMYRYGGTKIKSPALESAGEVVSKVAWGLAIPTIVIASIIYGHVSAKYIFVRIYAKRRRPANTWPVWIFIVAILWIVAWVIGESIPVFNDLLGLIASLFGTWFTYGITGAFWLSMNKGHYTSSWCKMPLTALNVFCLVVGATISGVGLYASGYSINQATGRGKTWSCNS